MEKKPPTADELRLLDILDQLRDAFNLAIEAAMRDIRRVLHEKE
jgi:hypothetical protein